MRSLTLIQLLFLIATVGMAQTPDGRTPAEEDVCSGLKGAAFGLCNAYCEAMDCDSEIPNASEKACSRTRDRFLLATGGDDLPCVVPCPCAFDLDFSEWSAEVNVICKPTSTAGSGFIADAARPPFLGVDGTPAQGTPFCALVDAAGQMTEFQDGLTAQEVHACSLDVIAYLQALRAARGDLVFSGDDLDSCEAASLP